MGKITGFKEFERQERPYKPVAERVSNFDEFVIPLDEADSRFRQHAAWIAASRIVTVAAR